MPKSFAHLMTKLPCSRCGQSRCKGEIGPSQFEPHPECPRPGCTPAYRAMREKARRAAEKEAQRE